MELPLVFRDGELPVNVPILRPSFASSFERVLREMLQRGAEPAVVAKRGHGDEVEMELYTRGAAKKARLIRDDSPPRHRGGGGGFGGLGSFFGGMF